MNAKAWALALLCLLAPGLAHAAGLNTLERQVYGAVGTGETTARLETLERDLFGRPLPGEAQSREAALVKFFNTSTEASPSLNFKVSMLAWALGDADGFVQPISRRLDNYESWAGAQNQTGKPLSMRVETLVGRLFGDSLAPSQAVAGAGTVVRLVLLSPLSANAPEGTEVVAQTTADVVAQDRQILAPRGSLVIGKVVSTSPAKGASQVNVTFDGLYGLGDEPLPLAQNGGSTVFALKGTTAGVSAGTTLLAQVAQDVTTKAYRPTELASQLRAQHPLRAQTLTQVSTAPEVTTPAADALAQVETTAADAQKVASSVTGSAAKGTFNTGSPLDVLVNEGVIDESEVTGRPKSGFTLPDTVKPLTDVKIDLSKLWPFGKKKTHPAPEPAQPTEPGTKQEVDQL